MPEGDKTIQWLGLATTLALAAVGLYVRVTGIEAYWFSPDDLLHTEIASGGDLSEVWENSSEQMHPPLVFFLLHFLTRIDLSPGFLRWIPVVPGVAVIIAFYSLGRHGRGTAAGITMAFVATFGYGGIILSQIIRPYCLLVLLLSIALTSFFAHGRDGLRRHAILYCLAMSVAVFLHYSAAIPFGAIGLVWLGRALVRKEGPAAFRTPLLANLLPALILGGMFLYHVRKLSGLYDAIRQTYLGPYFVQDVGGLVRNIYGVFGFLLIDEVAPIAMAIAAFGLVTLMARKGHREVGAVVLVCLVATIALNLLRKYPFGGIRHSFYLFPMLALLLGSGVQFAVEWLAASFAPAVERHRRKLAAAGLAVVLGLSWPIVDRYSESDYLRVSANSGHYSAFEFPTRKGAYDELIGFLDTNFGPGDVIVATRQASHYLRYETRYDPAALERLPGNVLKLRFRGKTVFVPRDHLYFASADDLTTALRKLRDYVDFAATPTVWVVDMGWGDSVGELARSDNAYSRSAARLGRRSGVPGRGFPGIGTTLAVSGRDIADQLSR